MRVYQWRPTFHAGDVDAGEAGEEIDNLREKHDGGVTPDQLIKQAKKKKSALHSMFEWDDKKAAHESRRTRAREILRGIKIIRPNQTRATTYLVAVKSDDGPRQYTDLAVAVRTKSHWQAVLDETERLLSGLNLRLGDLMAAESTVHRMKIKTVAQPVKKALGAVKKIKTSDIMKKRK